MMNNGKLTEFEKYAIESNNCKFDYTFDLILFVIKLNEYVIEYYQDSIYSYILRNRLEKKKGRSLSDEEFNECLNNNYQGVIFYPINKLNQIDYEYIRYLMNNLLSFTSKVNYQDLKYANFIKKAKVKKLKKIITYQECLELAKILLKLEKYNLSDYVIQIEQEIKNPKFNFNYQLHDFINRLSNDYIDKNDFNSLEKIQVIKKDIKPLEY